MKSLIGRDARLLLHGFAKTINFWLINVSFDSPRENKTFIRFATN